MCGWNPFDVDVTTQQRKKKTLDEFGWYEGLYRYSRPKAANAMEEDGDDDIAEDEAAP